MVVDAVLAVLARGFAVPDAAALDVVLGFVALGFAVERFAALDVVALGFAAADFFRAAAGLPADLAALDPAGREAPPFGPAGLFSAAFR